MAVKSSIKISSFNCTGIKSSIDYISNDMCGQSDIIALQELWIYPDEVELCQNIHKDFTGFAKSSVDVERGPLRGRPYGGLGFLWRSSLDAHVTPVAFEEDRLMGLRNLGHVIGSLFTLCELFTISRITHLPSYSPFGLYLYWRKFD